jgi:hypothetical protein
MLLAAISSHAPARLALDAAWCERVDSRALARALSMRANDPELGALALYVLAELVRADAEAGAQAARDTPRRRGSRAVGTRALRPAASVPVLLRMARGACDEAAAEAVLALCALAACPDARASPLAKAARVPSPSTRCARSRPRP